MPNYVVNKLTILSNNEIIMERIKEVLLTEDNNETEPITMRKLLPPPKNKFCIAWNLAAWGTKWDMFNASIRINNQKELSVIYDTAWCPNCEWTETLCRFIQSVIESMMLSEIPNITIEHHFYDESGWGFAGYLTWRPNSEIIYSEFDIMEYMYTFNKPYHDWLVTEMGYEPFYPALRRFEKLMEKYCDKP
jgi:hypothetical protein